VEGIHRTQRAVFRALGLWIRKACPRVHSLHASPLHPPTQLYTYAAASPESATNLVRAQPSGSQNDVRKLSFGTPASSIAWLDAMRRISNPRTTSLSGLRPSILPNSTLDRYHPAISASPCGQSPRSYSEPDASPTPPPAAGCGNTPTAASNLLSSGVCSGAWTESLWGSTSIVNTRTIHEHQQPKAGSA
jgi:hypothetical protein